MTFQERLKRVMTVGNLRVADLAKLFGRRHSTVRGWVVDGREPAGTAADIRELFARLSAFEVRAKHWKSLAPRERRWRIMREG
jgi:hypothetical protein